METCDITFTGGLTLTEALQLLEDDNFPYPAADIIMLPPENACGNITDEDSGEEDDVHPDNLPATQLRAPAELSVGTGDDQISEFEAEDEIPLAQLFPKQSTKRRKITSCKWTLKDFETSEADEWPRVITYEFGQTTPLALFELFFDDTLLDILVDESNRYAAQKNKTNKITKREMKSFLGVLILSGYIQLPRRRMFWEREKDTHNELVANAIPRDGFEFIMTHIHVADNNNLDANDKFAKVRPLFQYLNRSFLQLAPLEESHSVDEAMVPYYGRHGCKQYIHGKPIRYGYKFWMGCTRLGYVNWFEPYQGATTHIGTEYIELGVGAGVVLTYADCLKSKWPNSCFHLYFDNFFNSCTLLTALSDKELKGTGTIRTNRLASNPFSSINIKSSKRGHYEYRMCEEERIVAVQWNDNSVVTMCSNAVGVHPVQNVKRFSRRERKTIYVQQPHMIKLYNANMGGVDRCDENISLYRISIRGKKWYFPLITHCIDMAVHNAWQLHKHNGGSMDHLAFRRQIATTLLLQNKKLSQGFSRGKPARNENMGIRYDRLDHWVLPQDKQTKCRHCHTKTTTRCEKCDVGLHVKCFIAYHTL